MTGDSLEVRIAQRITADGSAIIPPRISRLLEDACKMTADRRIRLRDADPDAYVALAALHLSALCSESGTKHVEVQPNNPELRAWISTRDAAKTLNVTDRCIRKWCVNGRLQAEVNGGRWLVNPTSIARITKGENNQ